MNWDRIEGNWKQAKGRFKEHWGRMTHRHLYVIDGRRDRTLGEIQESYGVAKDEVSREVKSRKQTQCPHA